MLFAHLDIVEGPEVFERKEKLEPLLVGAGLSSSGRVGGRIRTDF